VKSKIFLLILALLSFRSKSFAGGQNGLEAFILIIYAVSVCLYTIIGGIIIKIIFKLVNYKNAKSNWLPFIIAFFVSLIAALLGGDRFIPFFWS
jgi:hypothetical protein